MISTVMAIRACTVIGYGARYLHLTVYLVSDKETRTTDSNDTLLTPL